MNRLILTNGKYVRTEIKFGRTLPLATIEMSKDFKMVNGSAFHKVKVKRQFNCTIFILGSYVYYFDLSGDLSAMLHKTPSGTVRVNENFAEYNDILETFMEIMTTWKLEN